MPDPTPVTPPPSAPVVPATSTAAPNKLFDVLFKVLAAAVLPLVVWGINLYSQQATQELRIGQLEKEVTAVKPHALALVRLEEQIKAMNGTLVEIKGILNRPPIR